MNAADDVEQHRALAGNCREVEARQRVGMRPRDCHYATEPRYLQDLPRSSRPTVTRSEHDGSVGRSRSCSAFTCSPVRVRQEYCCGEIAETSREGERRIADYKSWQLVICSAGSIMYSNCLRKSARFNSTPWAKSTAVELVTEFYFTTFANNSIVWCATC